MHEMMQNIFSGNMDGSRNVYRSVRKLKSVFPDKSNALYFRMMEIKWMYMLI